MPTAENSRQLSPPEMVQVLPGVGLCICVYDIKSIGDAIIIPGDGNAYTEGALRGMGTLSKHVRKVLSAVAFELLVFRPAEDSVLTGTIKACNEQGIQVSLVFFDDIFIPAGMMLPGTVL